MSAQTNENGINVYRDIQVEVRVNVNPAPETGIDYHRPLNCIKITAASSNVHFLQFVTRQYPDIYEFNTSGKIQWDSEPGPFYMQDSINPRWKLDITEDSSTCFYEEKGLSKKDENSTSMYDDPGGLALPEEDRATFCTFVMIDNKITHLIQWSKQSIESLQSTDPEECYLVHVTLIKNKPLPLWALDIVNKHYITKTTAMPKELIEADSLKELATMSAEQLKVESRMYFLQPPDNWCTFVRFPLLHAQFKKETQAILESQKKSSPANLMFQYPMSELENQKNDALRLVGELSDAVGKNKDKYQEIKKYYESIKNDPLLSNDFRDLALIRFSPMTEKLLEGTKKEYIELISNTKDKDELRRIILSLDKLIQQELIKKVEITKTIDNWAKEDREIRRGKGNSL